MPVTVACERRLTVRVLLRAVSTKTTIMNKVISYFPNHNDYYKMLDSFMVYFVFLTI